MKICDYVWLARFSIAKWILVPVIIIAVQAKAAPPFQVVFIDSTTEKMYGNFPFSRLIIADGIRKIRTAGARGIVLKFFYDLPTTKEADESLATAISNIPCALQACIHDEATNLNLLPEKYFLGPSLPGDIVSGRSGWLPLNSFATCARSIGFVDVRNVDSVPLVETYQGRAVKSLYTCALELATGETASFTVTNRVRFGSKYLPINAHGEIPIQLPQQDTLDYLPLHKVLTSDADVLRAKLQSSVVIIGYDGPSIPCFQTKIGSVKAHRLFIYGLYSIYESPHSE